MPVFWRSDGDYPCVGQQISRRDNARRLSPPDLRTTLPEVRPASDINSLPSHTPAKATTDGKEQLEHLTKRLNRLWIHMTARIRFNIPTGTKGPVMNGKALFRRFARTCRCCDRSRPYPCGSCRVVQHGSEYCWRIHQA